MTVEQLWRKTINRKGLGLLSFPGLVLRAASVVYRPLFLARRAMSGQPARVGVPTISIGSITVGGSGKTPLTCFLARALSDEGIRVGIVSSGYGRTERQAFVEPAYKVQRMPVEYTSDEVMLVATEVPSVWIAVNDIKARAASDLAATGEVDVILVDDGFQHFALEPDIHLVTYDAGVKQRLLKLFPGGVLREPVRALERADIIIITRANFSKDIQRLREEVEALNPRADVYQAGFSASAVTIGSQQVSPKYLRDKSVLLFAGVGNFRALKKQVKAMAGDLDLALELADHQEYSPQLLQRIKDQADELDSDLLLTTAKDMVKIKDFDFGRDLGYLDLIIDMDPGEEKLVRDLIDRLELPVEEQ